MKKNIHKNKEPEMVEVLDQELKKVESEKVPIEEMPLNTIRDYRLYNEEARKLNKKLGVCRYKIKQCPVELHPKQRIKFSRNDQPGNPLPVYLSNELIHFEQKLVPGKTYDLPECVVHYLSDKGNPVWKWFNLANGERETGISHYVPRFSLTSVYSGDN